MPPPNTWSSKNDHLVRLCAAESLELGQAERRTVRERQPTDRRPDAREGTPRRSPSPPTLLPGNAERREGGRDARGIVGARPWWRGIRCLADQNRPRRSVRERLCWAEPQLQDPGLG